MIKFRQKEFVAPVLAALGKIGNAALIGSSVVGVKQASDQAKQAEEQQQEMLAAQKRENAKLVKALNNVAANAQNNPQAAAQAAQIVGQARTFSVKFNFLNKAGRFVKDVVSAVGKGGTKVVDKKNFFTGKVTSKTVPLHTGIGKVGRVGINMASAGIATGATAYGLDKAMTADARNIGMMPRKEQKSYSVMSQVGTYAKKGLKYAGSKENLKKAGGWAAFAAIPAIGYIGKRSQFKDQVNSQQVNSEQQRSYAIAASMGSLLRKGGRNTLAWWKKNTKNWKGMQTVTGAVSNLSTFGMAGRRDVQRFAKRLQQSDKGTWANALGRGMEKHKNLANLGVAAIGATAIGGTYNKAEKLTKKALGKADKDAFAYEKWDNNQQQVEQ